MSFIKNLIAVAITVAIIICTIGGLGLGAIVFETVKEYPVGGGITAGIILVLMAITAHIKN